MRSPAQGGCDGRPSPGCPRWPLRRVVLLVAVIAWLGLLLLLPLGALAAHVVDLGIGRAWSEASGAGAGEALLRSLGLAGLAVAINGVLGVLGAIVLVRHRFPFRWLLDQVVDLPLAVSPVMIGLAFLLVFGRGGLLEPLLEAIGLRVAFAWPGLVIGTLFVTIPFTIREVSHVLRELGTGEEEAAAVLGASPWRTFWRITMPDIARSLSCGSTLTLSRSLGEFGAVLVLGGAIAGRTDTATTFIYAATEARSEAASYGMALLLACITMGLLAALGLFHRRDGAAQGLATTPEEAR